MHLLQELGFSYYESKALDVILKEKVTPKILSKKAQIPLGKVYSILQGLLRKNLIQETQERPKQLYIANPFQVLSTLIQQKQHQDETLYNEVRYLATTLAKVQNKPAPFFQIGTSLEENQTIQLRTFREANQEVCQILNIHHKPKSNRTAKSLWEKEISKAIERGVRFRSIYPKHILLPTLLQNLPQNSFQVRKLNTDYTRCDIIDRKKVLVKLVSEDAHALGGILFIENEKLARNLQEVFEEMWREAKP